MPVLTPIDIPVIKTKENNLEFNNQNKRNSPSSSDNIQSPTQEIKIGQLIQIDYKLPIEFTDVENDQVVNYYHFKIENVIPDQELVILLIGRRDYIHSPSLYLSQTDKNPKGDSDNDLECGVLGIDICTINSDQIVANQDYYLGIFCSADCQFQLKIKYESEKIMYIGEQYVMTYGETDSEIIKLIVSGQPDTTLNSMKNNILIEAYLLNPEDVDQGFQLYAQIGDYVQQITDEGYPSYDIWWNGQAIKINSEGADSQWDIAVDQNFTIFVVAVENSIIKLTTEFYGQKREMNLQVAARDIVVYEEKLTYELQLPYNYFGDDFSSSLSIDLEPYYGVPELFINYLEAPETLQGYKWHITLEDDSEESGERDGVASLTISNLDLKEILGQNSSRSFFLTVRGVTTTSFKLLAYASELSQRMLAFDCTESGYLKGLEKEDYELDIQGIRSTQITIKLHTIKGFAALYVKKCQSLKAEQHCILTKTDIDNREILSQNDELYYVDSATKSKNYQIQFFYDSEWYHGDCEYTVTVIAKGQPSDEIHYRLLARKENSLVNLKENQQHQSYLQIDEKEYYQFYIQPNDTSIQKVIIQVGAVSGELRAYASRSFKYPNEEINDQQSLFSSETFEYNINSDTINGFYYIGVESITATTYNIQVKVYRRNGVCSNCLASKEIKLHLGNPQQGVLYYGQIEKYYFYVEEYPESDHRSNIFIYFHAYDKVTNEQSFVQLNPKVNIYFRDVNMTVQNAVYEQSSETSNFLYYEVYTNQTETGRYVIELTHDFDKSQTYFFKYSIAVNADDVWEVTPEVGYVNQIESGERENYQIYIATPSQVNFEFFECFGKFQMKSAESYEDLENENYNADSQLLGVWRQDHHKVISYNITQVGSFWFSVISKKGEGFQKLSNQQNESLYMVVPHVLGPNEQSPHDIFYTPTESDSIQAVEQQNENNRTYQITFKELQSEIDQKFPFTVQKFVYLLHISDSEYLLPVYSKCDLDKNDLAAFNIEGFQTTYHKRYTLEQDKLNNKINSIIIGDLPKGDLFIQIMAIVYIKTSISKDSQQFNFLYDVFTIQQKVENTVIYQNEQQPIKPLASRVFEPLVFMIIGGVLALVCAGYWLMKYRARIGLLPDQMEMSQIPTSQRDMDKVEQQQQKATENQFIDE